MRNDITKQIHDIKNRYNFNQSESEVLCGELNIDPLGTDIYSLIINISTFPNQFPIVQEVGDRIPCNMDRHINTDGTLCFTTEAKAQIILRKKVKTLLDFFEYILIPFLQNNSYYEIHKEYLNGEYKHGLVGIFESYADIIDIDNLGLLIDILLLRLDDKKFLRNDICFCGSGKKVKNCHLNGYNDLFLIDNSIIKSDLLKLKQYLQLNN